MEWIEITLTQAAGIFVSVILVFFILMVFTKINGLRSFAKMSAHDFAVTIAIGSILGAVVTQESPTLMQGGLAIGTFLFLQSLYSFWRIYRPSSYLENEPLLLMDKDKILYENLKRTKITESDLIAKLREANVLSLEDVQAVVLETTGDISVLHGDKDVSKYILKNVRH